MLQAKRYEEKIKKGAEINRAGTVSTRLTLSEVDAVRKASASMGLTMSEFIRRLLIADEVIQ